MFVVISAKLGNGGFFPKPKSPDVYVEVTVDSNNDQAKRTGVKKKTNSPQWDETFSISVNENSVVEFKVEIEK